MNGPSLPPLSLAHRTRLFDALRELPTGPDPVTRCSFDGQPGWVVSQLPVARSLITSAAGCKARPASSQRLLGGVGALRGAPVRQVKRQLVEAMLAEPHDAVSRHLHANLMGQPLESRLLTEALSAALLTQLCGRPPGSVDGALLRRLVVRSWNGLERDHPAGRLDDELACYLTKLVDGAESPFLGRLRGAGWSTRTIAEELRGMVLAGWGSTTAATLSALALGAGAQMSRATADEVLRLYPPSFMIARTITEPPPRPLPFVPGEIVVVSPWLIHRDPAGWADPERFDPGRWRRQPRDRWFLPFGLGPRRCPAAAFARTQMTAAVDWYSARLSQPAARRVSLVESRSPALVPSW